MSAVGHLREAAQSLQAGDTVRARAALDAALALAPRSADALNLLGLLEHRAGNLAAAIDALERATAVQPRYANAWHNLAAVLDESGDGARAARALRNALVLARDAGAPDWNDLGTRAQRAGLLDIAAEAYERTLALAPQELDALGRLAVVRDLQHRPVDARSAAQQLLDAAPMSAYARYVFAAIWSKATAHADLERSLSTSLALLADDARHAGAHDCAAIVLGKLGARSEALAHAREALALAPGNADYVYTLARLLEEDGALEDARAVLEPGSACAPHDARLLRLLGTVRLRSGDAGGADAAFAAALAAAPDDQAAIAQRALALRAAGDAAAADAWLGTERFLHETRLPLPAGYASLAALNTELARDIRAHSRLRFEPVGLAAKDGYLTDDLLADRTPAILAFERSLRAAIDAYLVTLRSDESHPFLRSIPAAYRLNLWATRVAAQGTIDTHIHEQSWLSGAYYVELPPTLGAGEGGDPHAGWIEFGRPYRGLEPAAPPGLVLRRPAEGTLLLFPSYLFHRTLPFAGSGERISISFDLAPA